MCCCNRRYFCPSDNGSSAAEVRGSYRGSCGGEASAEPPVHRRVLQTAVRVGRQEEAEWSRAVSTHAHERKVERERSLEEHEFMRNSPRAVTPPRAAEPAVFVSKAEHYGSSTLLRGSVPADVHVSGVGPGVRPRRTSLHPGARRAVEHVHHVGSGCGAGGDWQLYSTCLTLSHGLFS